MNIEIACSTASRLRGLLGRREFSGVLVLAPCNDIHTFGMRQPIDVAFISSDGEVLESCRSVGVRRRIRCGSAVATLERLAVDAPWFERGDHVSIASAHADEKGDVS